MNITKVDLNTICGGALPELFERELLDVMANVADINTDPKKPRRITMTVDIYPHNDRKQCEVELGVTSKTLPVVKVSGSLFIAQKGSSYEGYTTDIRQQDIFHEVDKAAEPKRPYVLKEEGPSA